MTLGPNRAWLLRRRPEGAVSTDDFEYRDDLGAPPPLRENQILVRNRIFSCAPTIRNWLNPPGESYRGSIGIGEPVRGMAGAEIVQSRHPGFAVGDLVTAIAPWQDFAILTPDSAAVPVTRVAQGIDLLDAMTVYSANSLTAYVGLNQVGRVKAGETVLISGAAGSVGAMACQIARNLGCHVVGIAGGAEKCAWLRAVCGVEAVDYRQDDVGQAVSRLCPDGVNLFFDNVGGDLLDMAIDHMAPFGRIIVSGQISAYDGAGSAKGPGDMMKLVYNRLRIEGFLVGDHASHYADIWARLRSWSDAGQLTMRTDRREGFSELPSAFVDLFRGLNRGTLLVEAS